MLVEYGPYGRWWYVVGSLSCVLFLVTPIGDPNFFLVTPRGWLVTPKIEFLVTPRCWLVTPKIQLLVTPCVDWWPPKIEKIKKSFSDYDWVSKTSLRCVFSISNIRLSIWYMYNRFFDFFQKCDLGRFLWPDSCDPKQYVSRLKIVLTQNINVRILKN